MNKNKKIIIAVAAAVLAVVIFLLVFGIKKGWFKKNADTEETVTSISAITREGSDIVEKEEVYENGELKYTVEKSYADEEGKTLAEEKYIGADEKLQKHLVYAPNGKAIQLEEYFDEDGKLDHKVERLFSDAEGNVLYQERYINKDGALEKSTSYTPEGGIEAAQEYKDSKISVEYRYENGEPTGEYVKYTYTDDKKDLGTYTYNKDDKLIKKIERTYNDDGNITLYHETDGEGNTISKTVYNYNKDGFEEKTVFYNSEGITGYVEYTYEDGKKVRMDEYDKADKQVKYILFTYDKDGNAKSEEHFPDQENTSKAN